MSFWPRRIARAPGRREDPDPRSTVRFAPEADYAATPGKALSHKQLSLDSMEFPYFISSPLEQTGIGFPEADHPKLFTPDGAVDYLNRATVT